MSGARLLPSPSEPLPEPPDVPAGSRNRPPRGLLTLQKVRAAWQSVRGKVESERGALAAPLSRATVGELDGRAIVLRFPDGERRSVARSRRHGGTRGGRRARRPLSVVLRTDAPGPAADPQPRRGKAAAAPAAFAAAPAARTPAVAQDGLEDADNPDELFSYLNERISDR